MHSWQIGTGSGRAGFQVLSSVDFYLPAPLTPFLLLFPISRNQQYINHLNSWSMGFFRQPHATRLQSSIIFRVIFFSLLFLNTLHLKFHICRATEKSVENIMHSEPWRKTKEEWVVSDKEVALQLWHQTFLVVVDQYKWKPLGTAVCLSTLWKNASWRRVLGLRTSLV